MKSCTTLFFFMFCFVNCFSQSTKEEFINAVRKTIFNTRKSVFIDNKAENVLKTFGSTYEIDKEYLGTIAPMDIANELYNGIKDTTTEYWNCQTLKKTKCISYQTLKEKEYLGPFHYVSKPVFSNDRNWCIVSVSGTDTHFRAFGWGDLYLFHKVNSKWEIHLLSRWIN